MPTATAERERIIIGPQPGPQTEFLQCSADIAIYGGAVFGGKTFGSFLDSSRFIQTVPGFGAVFFRRQLKQVNNEGGLWDKARKFFQPFKATPIENPYRLTFPPFGNKIEFHHLNQENDVDAWDGSEIAGIYFEELQHFLESQFWYIQSRNRTACGVKPYTRATCNPVKNRNHWLRKLLDWWIGEDGWPIPERSGVIRYLLRIDNVIHWADTPEELIERFPTPAGDPDRVPVSFTFIPAKMEDNAIGLAEDPNYRAKVESQVEHERLRMLGNWNATPKAGELMKREDFDIVEPDEVPWIQNWVRYWDRAGTEPHEANPDPDWTAGARLGIDQNGITYITNVERFRKEPQVVMKRIKIRTKLEAKTTTAVLEHDPGQAGKAEMSYYYREFKGLPLDDTGKTPKASKLAVWRPFASQARAGRVKLVRGEWIDAFLDEAESVIDGTQSGIHDDQIDSAAGAFMYLTGKKRRGAQGGAALNVM